MNTETNFMSFENLTNLIKEHKKETHPYKRYEFDSTSYTLLLISINDLIKENTKLINQQKEFIKYLEKELNEHKNKEPFIVANICSSYDLTQIELNILKDILQKYKSIIGQNNG